MIKLLGLALLLFVLAPILRAEAIPQLQITGGSEEQRANIHRFLPLTRHDCAPLAEFRKPGVIRDAQNRATQALRALGYYQPSLDWAIVTGDDCWALHLDLDTGLVTQIAAIDIQVHGAGADDAAFAALRASPGLRVGDALRHDAYDRLRSRLARLAAERGYLQARLTRSELKVDPEQYLAWIHLHLDTGPRHRFGPIQIEQDILSERFLQRYLPLAEGDDYSSAQLLSLQRNLNDSNYFQSVRVRPQLEAIEDQRVPITVELEPRKRKAYELRLGFSTDRGPRLGVGFEHRYVNRRGHRYTTDLELSERRSGAGFNYLIPLADPLREHLSLTSSFRREDSRTSLSERFQIGASRVEQGPSGWQITQGLRYEYEESTVADTRLISNLFIPSYQLQRIRSNDPLHPSRGWRLDLMAQGASADLGSNATFGQLRGNSKWIYGQGSGRIILRGDAGVTFSNQVTDLPGSLRFFAGGDSSIRGFGFQRLGPTNADGRIIGGRHLLVGSLEYDYFPGGSRYGVAAFVDAGNAFDHIDDYDPKLGFGLGLRWRSPLGPLRLDLAHAPDSVDDFRIHFTMGPDL